MQPKNNGIIFLFGAGASVEAEVPDTREFIFGKEGFLEWLKEEGNKVENDTINRIIEILRKHEKGSDPDLELVLGTINVLNNKETQVITEFVNMNTFVFNEPIDKATLESLEDHLKSFIHKKVMVNEDKIGYLEPLIEFIEPNRPLIIFSLNYDTCIELLCNKNKVKYTDGFGLTWNHELFNEDGALLSMAFVVACIGTVGISSFLQMSINFLIHFAKKLRNWIYQVIFWKYFAL